MGQEMSQEGGYKPGNAKGICERYHVNRIIH